VPITHVNGVDLAYEEYGDGFPLIWVQGQASKLIQQVNSFEPNTGRAHPCGRAASSLEAAEQVQLNQGAAQRTIRVSGATCV